MQDTNGFTLIELLITLVVLSFGLLGLAGLQVQLVRANSFNSSMTIATTIGTDLLEEAKAVGLGSLIDLNDSTIINNPAAPVPYGDINGDNNVDVSDIDFDNDGTPDDPYNGRFTWTRQLTWDTNVPRRFCRVDVSVFWSDTSQHQLDFRTVVE